MGGNPKQTLGKLWDERKSCCANENSCNEGCYIGYHPPYFSSQEISRIVMGLSSPHHHMCRPLYSELFVSVRAGDVCESCQGFVAYFLYADSLLMKDD